jgi:dinuclear metal center YbgI/SA1388 family protein
MIKIKDIVQHLESLAPLAYQEDYDNAGLLTGNGDTPATGMLIALDCTEQVVDEAISKGCNMIISHHPAIFKPLKKLTGGSYVERTVIKAIQNNIALYSSHTNLDSVSHGVNKRIADKLGLVNTHILQPKSNILGKLTTFVPVENTEAVLSALHAAGAGMIGEYKNCSFLLEGTGTFLPSGTANPSIGQTGVLEKVRENRIEVIFPMHIKPMVMSALFEAHPYEEVAYYLHSLENSDKLIGAGMIGELQQPMKTEHFINLLKSQFRCGCIRHTAIIKSHVKTIALCGGSGSFLLPDAIKHQADMFVSADFKYHDFFNADGKTIIADIGHYESEQYTKELLYEHLREIFPNIALHFTEVNTNPIHYA